MLCISSFTTILDIMMGKRARLDVEDEKPKNAIDHMQLNIEDTGEIRESFKRIKVEDPAALSDQNVQTRTQDYSTTSLLDAPVYFSARVTTRDTGREFVNYEHNQQLGTLVQLRRESAEPKQDVVDYSEMNRVLGERFSRRLL